LSCQRTSRHIASGLAAGTRLMSVEAWCHR
jgi:hypothetical protein